MKFHYVYFTATLLISTVSTTPLPTRSQISEPPTTPETTQLQPDIQQSSSTSPFSTFAIISAGTALITGLGIGLSEWFLHWYPRHITSKHSLTHKNLTFTNDLAHRKQQQIRRERAMDLILEMAENYADKITQPTVQEGGFNGEFNPLKVPKGIIGVVENVFEVTEGVDGRGVEALDGLKEVVAPVLDFSGENDGSRRG
jgi:hypothetical protein